MRNLKCKIVFLFLFSISSLSAQKTPIYTDDINYIAGEKLKFIMYYGIINGGIADLTLTETTFEGKKIHHAKMDAYTTGLTDKLFKVRDIYESYFNPETGLPRKSVRNIKEGKYKYYNEVLFDQIENKVLSQKSGEHDVPPNILDMVSVLYQLRRIDFTKFKSGDSFDFKTYFGDELFPFEVRYKGTETISTKLGKISCHKFVPIVEPGRIFKEEDDMSIWISNDLNKVPIRIRFEMIVGSFNCDLLEYSNLKYPLIKK